VRHILAPLIATAALAWPTYAQSLAEVGGVPVTLRQVIAANPQSATDARVRNQVLIALVNRQAVLNEAKRTGLESKQEYKAELLQDQESLLINLMVNDFTAAHPVSSQQISETYERVFSGPMPEQYRYRQIVVSSFSDAEAAIALLKGGKDFSMVAEDFSEDQSADLGGEVGWQLETQIPAPILRTLQTMQIMQITGPLSIPQGYVIIQLCGRRSAPKPTLDQVRDKITRALEEQKWIEYVVKLRSEQGAHLLVPISGG